ncbi:hypothetical protein [Bradyrhizobium japonicum]|uniref:hypothetical protein n=1 Tax=Bradyrhizobium japonicum TaxID=375 RepID=UPI001269D22F|nr:hypothetical protein [Bradyrhizobium japonicum]
MKNNPEMFALRETRRREAVRRPEHRAKVSKQARELWATRREAIIAAQNAGKGDEYRRKQSLAGKAKWTNPDNRYWQVFLTPERRAEIRECLRRGMKGVEAAKKFGLSQSRISQIKHGA